MGDVTSWRSSSMNDVISIPDRATRITVPGAISITPWAIGWVTGDPNRRNSRTASGSMLAPCGSSNGVSSEDHERPPRASARQ